MRLPRHKFRYERVFLSVPSYKMDYYRESLGESDHYRLNVNALSLTFI